MNTLQAPRQKIPEQAWMLTFADLTSLLLCFFVLFYATLTISKPHWQTLVGAFAATFAPRTAVVTLTPSGKGNALAVVAVRRNVLYLDTLLRQRLENDAVWASLVGVEVPTENQYRYVLPPELTDPANPATRAAWGRLGAVLFNWRTPTAVRVVVAEGGNWGEASARAWALAELAQQAGGRVTAEVVRGNLNQTQWILYGADY
ncbi:MAG: flagellar motor protein MotB [Alphaproteobacteria bacterium]|nr:flagellar motor protein MotB [Alphaproteobacteria bacterium]